MTHTYRPLLPEADWLAIREFVTRIVAGVAGRVAYERDALLHAVTYHADWTHRMAGLDLDEHVLFRRDVIGSAVAAMPTTSPSTMGRYRSLLLRIGEALGVIAVAAPLPPLPAAAPSAPYSAREVDQLREWAYLQGDPGYRRSAQALLVLGLGAGLPTRDLAQVRRVDIHEEVVTVAGGAFPRRVHVDRPWIDDLVEVAADSPDPSATLFRPHVAFHKNTVLTFLDRSTSGGLLPSTQRMRVTWLVQRLTVGMPMHELLYQAGLTSMDALVRYQRFFPPPVLADGPDTTADNPGSLALPRPG